MQLLTVANACIYMANGLRIFRTLSTFSMWHTPVIISYQVLTQSMMRL
ncbi:MAG TPA: hypothetical protein PKK99_04340 [Bacteroidia bacterium]|nr:hypothetical protein [Bacteroidia bacterium]